MYILAGLLAAFMARFILGLALNTTTRAMIVFVGPGVEELLKTGLAWQLGAEIFYTHVVFGGVELLADSLSKNGIWPGLVALSLHSVLGYITVWLVSNTASLASAVFVVAVLHALWNYTAITLLGPNKRKF